MTDPRVKLRVERIGPRYGGPARMSRYNFNITFPICDALFGTRAPPER